MMITRRKVMLGALAGVGALSTRSLAWAAPELPQSGYAPTRTGERIYYEVTGPVDGPALFLAVPVYATSRIWTDAYLSYFTDKYRVLVADFPNRDRSDPISNPDQFTAARVADDYLSIATAAWGESRSFAIAGYSWGGNSSMILATITDRLSAMSVGGWPALEGPWERMLEISNALGSRTNIAYYTSLLQWADLRFEAKQVRALRMPRLNYVDASDDGDNAGTSGATSADMIGPFRRNRATLESWGWDTAETDGGIAGAYGHNGGIYPHNACPIIRSFLDKHL